MILTYRVYRTFIHMLCNDSIEVIMHHCYYGFRLYVSTFIILFVVIYLAIVIIKTVTKIIAYMHKDEATSAYTLILKG